MPARVQVKSLEEVIFVVRQPKGSHWYENMGYAVTDVNDKRYGSRGYLCKLNLGTGKVTLLVEDPQGALRDPQVHYDGGKSSFPTVRVERIIFISIKSMPMARD